MLLAWAMLPGLSILAPIIGTVATVGLEMPTPLAERLQAHRGFALTSMFIAFSYATS